MGFRVGFGWDRPDGALIAACRGCTVLFSGVPPLIEPVILSLAYLRLFVMSILRAAAVIDVSGVANIGAWAEGK